jgi:hypothetical protein
MYFHEYHLSMVDLPVKRNGVRGQHGHAVLGTGTISVWYLDLPVQWNGVRGQHGHAVLVPSQYGRLTCPEEWCPRSTWTCRTGTISVWYLGLPVQWNSVRGQHGHAVLVDVEVGLRSLHDYPLPSLNPRSSF